MNTELRVPGQKEIGDEPLPGYRLIEPLGSGGFGEVWKCEAPGGLHKAIKFVKGSSTALDGEGGRNSAQVEFQAIQRVKAVRHPFMLSLERVEVLDGELVLVMELADRNLADHFAECQVAGQTGIGRDELLGYLMEAAEALDVMNIKHGLQHLDIKPANLFIVGNHLKVADFGLVNSLEEVPADGTPTQLGGLTPLYVAPEILKGKMSRHTDQYSLAVVYQELLTGTHPFPGGNARQILMAHLMSAPDLTPLPANDRPVVARALAKEPDRRFASCLHFVQALVFGPDDPEVAGSLPTNRPSKLRQTPVAMPVAAPGATVVINRPRLPPAGDTRKEVQHVTAPAPATPDSGISVRTGLTLPGVQLLAHVGRGPFGDLYHARDGDGCERQVRYLAPAVGAAEADVRLLARLGSLSHPALPALEVKRTPDGQVGLVADAAGRTLQDRFDERLGGGAKGLARDELLWALQTAAAALDDLRDREQLQHLALSPRSLLVRDGRVHLGDFGLATLIWLPHWQKTAHPNRRYAAPELLKGAPNATCDAYSLALIFTEMLTGFHPLPNRLRSRSTVAGPAKPDLDWLSTADRAVVARALHADPQKRFQSCGELLAALAGPGQGATSPTTAPADGLPFIRPLASLFGGGDQRITGTPSINRIVTQVVLTETAAVTIGVAKKLPYLQRSDHVIECKFPIRMLPGMIRLKMEVFCEKWEAKVVSQTDRSFVVRLQSAGNFWQRCLGNKAGLEVRLDLQPAREANVHTSEASVTVQAFGGVEYRAAQKLQEVGPLLLVSLRDDLQNTPDQRGQVRWPCSPPLDVYPLEDNGKVTNVLEGKCKDISFSGIAFATAHRPVSSFVYLNLKTFPEVAPFVLLAEIVRVEPQDGGYRIGAAFVTTGIEGV